jgi:hypothetical protein
MALRQASANELRPENDPARIVGKQGQFHGMLQAVVVGVGIKENHRQAFLG